MSSPHTTLYKGAAGLGGTTRVWKKDPEPKKEQEEKTQASLARSSLAQSPSPFFLLTQAYLRN